MNRKLSHEVKVALWTVFALAFLIVGISALSGQTWALAALVILVLLAPALPWIVLGIGSLVLAIASIFYLGTRDDGRELWGKDMPTSEFYIDKKYTP